jgi:hypothetical protein
LTEWVRRIQAFNPFAQYLLALAGTIFAYGVYALVAVPLLEGEPTQRIARPVAAPAPRAPDRTKQRLAQWLPAGSWELESCKSLETAEGTIYFQDYMPRDDGVLEVFPFTMVFRDESAGRSGVVNPRNPLIIRASRRAELQFEGRVSWSGDPGRVLGGQLQGNVQLFQAPREGNPDEGFSVWTENIQLSTNRVSTIEQVEFQFGRHRGSGRNLVLDLAHKTPLELAHHDLANINGVKRLELAFVEDLKLDMTSAKKAAAGEPAELVDVSCAGPFVFDFEKSVASFRDRVQVKQLGTAGDSLVADQLDLIFNQVVEVGSRNSGDSELASGGKLELRKLVARGAPAVVAMSSREVRATATELEYDLQAGHIRARDPEMVEIRQAGQLIRAPQLDYRLREDGAIGTLLAEGAGLFARTDRLKEGGQRTSVVQWNRQLSVTQVAGGKLISVDGGADIRMDEATRITGEQLQLLLAETRVTDPLPPGAVPDAGATNERWDYQPQELQVTGDVFIKSNQMEGRTPKLRARWLAKNELLGPIPGLKQSRLDGPRSLPSDVARQRLVTDDIVSSEFSAVEVRQLVATSNLVRRVSFSQQDGAWSNGGPVSTPNSTAAGEQGQATAADQKTAAPLRFTGQEVIATLQQLGNQTDLRQLDIEGDVQVFQSAAEGMAEGWTLRGGHLTLIPQGAELHRISIYRDARVITPQMELAAPELQLDQAANRVWASGSGRAKLRPQVKPAEEGDAMTQVAEPAAKAKQQELEVEWQGGMIFDGEKVYFEHAVQSEAVETAPDGSQTVLRTVSEGLNLLLDRPVNLRQRSAGVGAESSELKIRQIVLVDRIPGNGRAFQVSQPLSENRPVLLEKYTVTPAGQMLDKQQIRVPRIAMELESGDVTATGPGEILQWKPGGSGNGQTSGLTSPLARAEATGSAGRSGLDYMHCKFDGDLMANTNRTEVRINERVRALYGVVPNWETQLDPDADRVPAESTRISCEQVQIVQWTPRGSELPTTEVLATRNARIVGSNFEATAERLSYNERSDLLVMEGDGRQDANLWFQQKPGAQRDHLVAGKILYRPGDQWTQIEKVRNATFNQGQR